MFDRRVTLTGARLRLLFVAPYVGIPTAVRRVLAVRRAAAGNDVQRATCFWSVRGRGTDFISRGNGLSVVPPGATVNDLNDFTNDFMLDV